MLGVRGMEVLVGVPALQARTSLPMSEWVVSERTVVGSLMGSTRISLDVPRLAEMYLEGRYKLDELVTDRYALEDINEAIDGVVRGDALRNVIVF
jgi:Zn-dependent alcohol dehydrogenase